MQRLSISIYLYIKIEEIATKSRNGNLGIRLNIKDSVRKIYKRRTRDPANPLSLTRSGVSIGQREHVELQKT